jgi:hypothetical protein
MTIAVFIVGVASLSSLGGALAAVNPGDTITATWSDVQTAGAVLNDPAAGEYTYVDNTATAVYSGVGTSTLTWGSEPTVPSQGTNYSSLNFTGSIIPSNYGSPFVVGTLAYTNGTSETASLIFGATLTFYDGSTVLGTDQVYINTTSNQYSGTGLSPAQLATDADYINICGQFSAICGNSIEAYEDTESLTGSSYYVSLTGYVDGLVLTQVQSLSGPGVIGSEPPLSSIPEPAAYMLMMLGAAAIGGVARRRRAALAGRMEAVVA